MLRARRRKKRTKGKRGCLFMPIEKSFKLIVEPFKALSKVVNPLWWLGWDSRSREQLRIRRERELNWRRSHLRK
jgi:hypothetical protein